MVDSAQITRLLEQVPDPEIPAVSVVDLGIVRDFNPETSELVITPTYSGCPATLVIESAIRRALDEAGLSEVHIKTSLAPPWTTDWISDSGREKLRAYGIAPPPKGSASASLFNVRPAECPKCGSYTTHEVSRFGSTPCKALWQCDECGEPFDRFKCH